MSSFSSSGVMGLELYLAGVIPKESGNSELDACRKTNIYSLTSQSSKCERTCILRSKAPLRIVINLL